MPETMDRVWIVQRADHGDTEIMGVYRTRPEAYRVKDALDARAVQTAERWIERRRREYPDERIPPLDDWRDHFMVVEYVLDVEPYELL